MNSERWQKVKALFDAVVELAPSARKRFLARSCGDDDVLRCEVEKLLASLENAESFMEQAAIGEVAEMLVGADNHLQIGARFNHYEILSHLGAGGMGEVYLAEDTKLHRRIALKLLPQSLSADKNANRRLLREAQSAAALDHPHICQIHEIGEAEMRAFIVMQFCEGETLAEKLRQENLSLPDALDLAIQIADALADAHSHHVIHRDIKPENIIVNNRGQVKILDFGLAKIIAENQVEGEAETAQLLTAANLIIGTPPYMSPEQAKGKPLDARSDIFSFGAMLYEMLSGKQVFKRESHAETVSAVLNYEPPFAKSLADAPPELQRIVRKTLAKDKEERYQTAKDLLIDLQNVRQETDFQDKLERTAEPPGETKTQILDVAETSDKSPKQISTEITAGERKNRQLGFIVGSIVLLFAIVGFGYWFFAGRTIESIAVLPFVNESGNADVEYLSDGMTETLISSLSQIPKLNVKARSSIFRYKGKETNAQTIGKELNVQAILTGRVVQRGQDLTLYITLVDAPTENVLWKQTYNKTMTNLVALQNDIARDVADNLKIKLSGADERKLAKNYTENAEAYRLYLKGRFYWLKFPAKEFEKSRDYYQQAIDVDPNYALAYSGLSEYYGLGAANGFLPPDENWSKSEAAANKALALDDTLPDAHNALAGVKQFHDDSVGAERELSRTIELNPNYAEGHNHYSYFLIGVGRFEESLAQSKKVVELEPLSVQYNRTLATRFFQMRDFDRAVEQFQKTLELAPNDAFTHELLGNAFEQKGMQKEAVAEWSKALRLTDDDETATMLERTFAASGFKTAVHSLWQKKLEQLNEKTRHGEYFPAMNYALAYTRLADKEQAFAWLAKAEKERNGMIFDAKLDPVYESLRDDSRFADLLRRVGLPQ